MLTPEQKRNIPTELVDLYADLGEFILRDIARRIAEGAKITETAEFQLYRARSLGLSAKEIAAKIAEINGLSAEIVEKLIRSAAEQSDEFDKRRLAADGNVSIPLNENEQLHKLIAAQIKETNGKCENLTNTLGFADHDLLGRVYYLSLTDMYRKELDAAHMKVVTGATDYTTAIRQAVNKLAASGVRTIDYESGTSRSVEAAVRTALMTSVSHVAHSISEQNGEEFGANGWEMSAHAGARPSHAIYQGRQYTQKEYEQKIKPLLSEPNCRHDVYPIILGVSTPVYTDEELQNIDPPPFTYEGKRYTAYEAQQQMRKMERAMRKQKNRCIVADAAGDKEGFTTASIKLRRQKDIYEDFCRKAGSFTQYERTIVGGYDRHLSSKTGAVTRKARAFEKAQMRLTDDKDSGIMKSRETIVVNGENVVGQWKPRSNFDNEIDDIIDFQGYNGKPTLIYDRTTFDECVERDHFLAERTFCADTEDDLIRFDNQLKAIDGEDYFYVNCGTGGAQYGQGMYCAADYTKGTITYDKFEHEIKQYAWGDTHQFNKTNWMTLDPSSKILDIPANYRRQECLEYVTRLYHEEYEKFRLSQDPMLKMHWQEYQSAMDEVRELYRVFDDEKWAKAEKLAEKLDEQYPDAVQLVHDINASTQNKDAGVMAAEMGYDAINAQGHGKTGSYTVVLNRTKLIIYGGDDYEYSPKS